jgi:hypothetical protein
MGWYAHQVALKSWLVEGGGGEGYIEYNLSPQPTSLTRVRFYHRTSLLGVGVFQLLQRHDPEAAFPDGLP